MTARRSENDWFVGTITNDCARSLELSLNFLPKGVKYIATIYSDDSTATTKTKVRVEKEKVDASTVLKIKLVAWGGQAIWLRIAEQ